MECDSHALIRDLLDRIGDRWSVVVLCRLNDTTRRFNELRRLCAPVTQRMLSSTLRGLERDGLVTRTVHPTVPPQVDYALTERGASLLVLVRQMVGWVGDHQDGILTSRVDFDGRSRVAG